MCNNSGTTLRTRCGYLSLADGNTALDSFKIASLRWCRDVKGSHGGLASNTNAGQEYAVKSPGAADRSD
jgi:hypothetical protein